MTERWIWKGGPGDPASLEWCGVVFPAGVAVEVNHPHLLKKMPGNPFFTKEVVLEKEATSDTKTWLAEHGLQPASHNPQPTSSPGIGHGDQQSSTGSKVRRKAKITGTQRTI